MKRIPRCFELSSWLKINLAESMLVEVGCANEDIQPLARKLPYKVRTLLTFGDNPISKTFWDSNNKIFLEESLWKRNFFSMGGSPTLIKSMLSTLPIHNISLFKMLVAVKVRLDHIKRNFPWEGSSNERKLHLMHWCDVMKTSVVGDLGLAYLELKNWTLITKWWWKYGEEREALWGECGCFKIW